MYSLILHGRRLCESQKWRHLTVSTKLLQNVSAFSDSFSSVTAAADVRLGDGREGNSFTISYLVGSLGLSEKLAESISRKVSFAEKGNPDSVLNLFRRHRFTDSQISSIITIYPRVLIVDAEKSLGAKLKFLQSRGASTSELTEIVSTVPKILGKKKGKASSAYYDFVKEIIEADKISKLQKLSHSLLPKGFKQENKIRNISVLRELGVPQKLLFSMLISKSPLVCGKEKFEESVKKVVEMGFDPTTTRFVEALRVVYGWSEAKIEEKVNVYKSLGFTVSDVWDMFKKWPMSLTHSEKKITQQFETMKKCGLVEDEVVSVVKKFPQCIGVTEQNVLNSIETFVGLGFSRDEFAMMVKRHPICIGYCAETVKKKIAFLVKKMNWPLNAVLLHPAVLGYSLEKRIVPRCDVIKALLSKGLLQGSEVPSMSSTFACTNEAFVKRYVMISDDKHLVLELMAIFTANKSKASEILKNRKF